MDAFEKMISGRLYSPGEGNLHELFLYCHELLYEFNQLRPRQQERKEEILRKLFGKCGKQIYVEAPFHCDYGCNIEVGENFYANYNAVILDVAKVIIGDNVLLAPNVGISIQRLIQSIRKDGPAARNSAAKSG